MKNQNPKEKNLKTGLYVSDWREMGVLKRSPPDTPFPAAKQPHIRWASGCFKYPPTCANCRYQALAHK